jgi:two-component system, chemotaxis family, sensor kinase CheA
MNIDHLRRMFLLECEANLQLIRRSIEAASDNTGQVTALQDLFRGAHSIKGGCGFFGRERIGRLADALENVCGSLNSGTLVVTSSIAAELTSAATFLADLVEAAEAGIELVEGYEQNIVNRLNALT